MHSKPPTASLLCSYSFTRSINRVQGLYNSHQFPCSSLRVLKPSCTNHTLASFQPALRRKMGLTSWPSCISPACIFLAVFLILSNMPCEAHLSPTFYDHTCPRALTTIRTAVRTAVSRERRMAASLIRLHFHDCFVQVLIQSHSQNFHFSFRSCCRKLNSHWIK